MTQGLSGIFLFLKKDVTAVAGERPSSRIFGQALVRSDGSALHVVGIFRHLSFFVPFYWRGHGPVGALIALYPDPLIHLS